MRTLTLTTRQREYLRAIWSFLLKHGRFPTYRELAETMPCARSGAFQMLQVLAAKGYLRGTFERHWCRFTLTGVHLEAVIDGTPEGARLAQALGLWVQR